jgi:hypothetical protein
LNHKTSNKLNKKITILQHFFSKLENYSDSKPEIKDQTLENHALSNIKHVPKDFLHVLTQITLKKYIIKITLIFSNDFKIDITALFDIGANLNCINEGIFPKWFLQNTFENVFAANNTKLDIKYKTQASIFNNGLYLKNFFVVTIDINYAIILGTLFIDMITPYKINHENVI